MKLNSIFTLFILLSFIILGCSDDDDDSNSQIKFPNQSEKNQNAYADEDIAGNFTFTAEAAWTAQVKEVAATRASNVSWVRLLNNGTETYSGQAGKYTLTIELDPNYSGKERKATITIICGDDEITITVVQNKNTEAGVVPKLISQIIYNDGDYKQSFIFSYDNRGRVKSYTYDYNYNNNNTNNKTVHEFTYEENSIIHKETGEYYTDSYVYKLNNKGNIVSYSESDNTKGEYTYNSNDKLLKKVESYNGTTETTTYEWKDENISSIKYKNYDADLYTYNNYPNIYNIDINSFVMDEWDAPMFFYLVGNKSKNLISESRWKSESPDDLTTYRYEFDTDGYATKIYADWHDEDGEMLWIEIKYLN